MAYTTPNRIYATRVPDVILRDMKREELTLDEYCRHVLHLPTIGFINGEPVKFIILDKDGLHISSRDVRFNANRDVFIGDQLLGRVLMDIKKRHENVFETVLMEALQRYKYY